MATAHGLYEVALAAAVPAAIAWLYPLITDGLALVAYAATARLDGRAARYAWSVVVVAAGLSGLAQAAYLAGGATLDASSVLRFGVGAWPAVAAAVVAHLLYLLVSDPPSADRPAAAPSDAPKAVAVQPVASKPTRALPVRPSDSPARDRAAAAAKRHARQHGALPTVRHLMELADVSRGTAGDVLKALRSQPSPLHLVNDDPDTRTQP